MAYVVKHQEQWLLINQKISGMRSSSGNIVPAGKAILLRNGDSFRISEDENGNLIEVVIT